MESPSGTHSTSQDLTIESNSGGESPKAAYFDNRSLSISSHEIHKKIKLTESTDQDDRLQAPGTGASLALDNAKVREEKAGSFGDRSTSTLFVEADKQLQLLKRNDLADRATIQSNHLANIVEQIITKNPVAPDSKKILLLLIEKGSTLKDVTSIEKLIASDKQLVETDAQASPISLAAQNGFDPIFETVLKNHTQTPQKFNTDEALFNACVFGTDTQKVDRCTQLLDKKWVFTSELFASTILQLIRSKVDFSFIIDCFPHFIDINSQLSNNRPFFAAILEANNTKMMKYVRHHKNFESQTQYLRHIHGHPSRNMTYLVHACKLGLFDIAFELLILNFQSAKIHSELLGTPLHAISFSHLDKDELKVEDYKKIIHNLRISGCANINETASIFCLQWDPMHCKKILSHRILTPIQTAIVRLNVDCIQAFLELENENENLFKIQEDKLSLQHLAIDSKNDSKEDYQKSMQIISLLSGHPYQII